MIKLSVIICSYNPNIETLKKVLLSLHDQTLDKTLWELIVVNNNSDIFIPERDITKLHENAIIIYEKIPGLSYARLAGFKACKKDSLIVFIDDDNILNTDYLETAILFNSQYPEVGCFGGRSIPIFEGVTPSWLNDLNINLGCQDFGDDLFISNYRVNNFKLNNYPQKAPIGTGMAITYQAFMSYITSIEKNKKKLGLGRKGLDLTSGEDNDIILTVIKAGFEIAYVPSLIIKHVIPKFRYNALYLRQMAYKSNRSWVKVLEIHKINPWQRIPKWTVLPRQIKAWFKLQAWKNQVNYIKWKGACGTFKGLSEI